MQAKSSTISEGFFLLFLILVAVGILWYATSDLIITDAMRALVILLLALLVPVVLTRFRIYKLDHAGILCTWFGFRCRLIPWDEVSDIARVYLKYGATVLLVTTKDGTVIRPAMDAGGMCPSSKELSQSMSKGTHLFLQDTYSVIACIYQYYGELNYDCKN